MGIDITGYSHLTPNPEGQIEISQAVLSWQEGIWPGRSAGLSAGPHSAEHNEHCRSMSYGGFGAFRRQLATLAGYSSLEAVWEADLSGPFSELLNFADTQGYFGPTVCAKLAQDFKAFTKIAETQDEFFRQRYMGVAHAFELGAQSGMVQFT